jgi:hypothetical protein
MGLEILANGWGKKKVLERKSIDSQNELKIV